MGAPQIFLEHQKGEKSFRYLRVKPEGDVFVIGTSKEADLRISGEGIAGCHAALKYRAPHWYVCDLSGDGSTLIDNEKLTEKRIDEISVIQIGTHKIRLFSKSQKDNLFASGEAEGNLNLHQIVVRSGERILETHILPATHPFKFMDGTETRELPAPQDGKWHTQKFGIRTIQQRLVPAQEVMRADGVKMDQDMMKPLAGAFFILLFLIGIVSLMPTAKKAEQALDKKSMDIIFNAKAIKKKKAESAKVAQSAKIRAGGNSASAAPNQPKQAVPDESTAPKVSAKASAALTSLRQSGLSNLIGKIAKRANKQGILVASVGATPDTLGAGRALFSHGTSTVGGGGSAAKAGTSYKLGGVATRGKGGGATNFGEGTALAGGSVGTGTIALIDEETVIEGGLDRDVIAEVIRRHLGEIRYCYERQLSSNPDLYGKIMVKFVIGAAGDVADPKVDSSTMKSAMVEGCVLRRVASWKFPLPKGGTTVKVSYPFLFKAFN